MYSGILGKITVDGTPACFASFDLDVSTEVLEYFCFGDEFKSKASGMKDWTASSDGTADFDDGGQMALYNAFDNKLPVDVYFWLDETTFFKGSAYMESLSISSSADNKADISVSLAGTDGILLSALNKIRVISTAAADGESIINIYPAVAGVGNSYVYKQTKEIFQKGDILTGWSAVADGNIIVVTGEYITVAEIDGNNKAVSIGGTKLIGG